MILTDREIKIAINRRLIQIDPPPPDLAFSSTAVDLTLDEVITTFNEPAPGVDAVIDPGRDGFNSETTVAALSRTLTIKASGYDLPPKILD